METLSTPLPRIARPAPRSVIPWWLALPAGSAALVAIAAVAATLFIVSDGHVDPPRAAPTQGSGAALDRRFDAARASHESGNHEAAFAALATLADEGHCESARLALQLIHAGPQAYLTSFQARPEQVSRWQRLPGCRPKAAAR